MEKFTQAPVGLDIDQTVSSNSEAIANADDQIAYNATASTDANIDTRRIFIYNSSTLHTPLSEGISWCSDGIVINRINGNFAGQLAIASGTESNSSYAFFVRNKTGGTWTSWQQLATKSGIDTLAISGISSSHTINASSSSAVLYGRVFHLRLSFRTTSAVSAFGTIATLPASMRPIAQFVGFMMDGNYDPVPFDITYNGALRIWKAASSGVDYSLDVTYIAQ